MPAGQKAGHGGGGDLIVFVGSGVGHLTDLVLPGVPWVPEVFLACGGNLRCWPKADTSSVVGRSHERRRREKNLWHGAVLFTVPVDL